MRMTSNCKASVIIPILNEESFISSSISSLLDSGISYLESGVIEIIIIDNGSTDKSNEIAKKFTKDFPNIHLISEPQVGVGYARKTGVRYGIGRSILREQSESKDFWIISTDADVTFPKNWIKNYLEAFKKPKSLFFGGHWQFPNSFNNRYPNAGSIFIKLNTFLHQIEQMFGVINLEGNNSAIERKCYSVVGPYEQPYIFNNKGTKVNLPGEDWDMGCRALTIGVQPKKLDGLTITRSARRVEEDLYSYFDGSAYEIEFKRVEGKNTKDIKHIEIEKYFDISLHRKLMHFVEKPILVNENLLKNDIIINFLGVELVKEMENWLSQNTKPDIFLERENFILKYLLDFHLLFGDDILKKTKTNLKKLL